MNKVVFGILTILFNTIGVPSFIAGNVKAGILTIVLNICFVLSIINWIMGIINGIKIITMADEDYEAADKATLVKCLFFSKKA